MISYINHDNMYHYNNFTKKLRLREIIRNLPKITQPVSEQELKQSLQNEFLSSRMLILVYQINKDRLCGETENGHSYIADMNINWCNFSRGQFA